MTARGVTAGEVPRCRRRTQFDVVCEASVSNDTMSRITSPDCTDRDSPGSGHNPADAVRGVVDQLDDAGIMLETAWRLRGDC